MLEGAPGPILRRTARNTPPLPLGALPSPTPSHNGNRRIRRRCRLRIQAVIPRKPRRFPLAIPIPAVLASARWCAVGVELGGLVQRDGVGGMGVAEDEAAVPAVVAALEEGESFLADGGVADQGVCVGLPVLPRGESGHLGQIVLSGFRQHCLSLTGGSRSPAHGTSGLRAFQAFGAPVDTARWCEGCRPKGFFCRAQRSRYIHG